MRTQADLRLSSTVTMLSSITRLKTAGGGLERPHGLGWPRATLPSVRVVRDGRRSSSGRTAMRLVGMTTIVLAGLMVGVECMLRSPEPNARISSPRSSGSLSRVGSSEPSVAVHGVHGNDADTSVSETVPGLVPDHLRERGPATIRLRFRRRSDGGTVTAIDGRLWRLRVPASHGWTAGDEVAMPDEDSLPEYVWRDLPCGTYRFECTNKRRGAADPPEFTIAKANEDMSIVIDECRTFPVRLTLYNTDGTFCDKCSVRDTGGWTHPQHERPPRWATPRVPEGWVRKSEAEFGAPVGDSVGEESPRPCLAASDGWIQVGEVTEDREGCESTESWEILTESGVCFTVRLNCWQLQSTDFVGIAPRRSEILENVIDEQNRSILEVAEVRLNVTCDPVPSRIDAKQWESIPVRVRVLGDGYRPLDFEWSVATRGQMHRLRRR